jgi:5,10-methylenetetrahydrofolate reductase
MRIADLLERQRPVFSFEFFPPRTGEGHQTLRNTLEVL